MLLACITLGCSSSTDPKPQECFIGVKFDGQSVRLCPDNFNDSTVILERPQDEFIWQAMNLYYFWQEDVPYLLDDRFANYDELHQFLNTYSNSGEVFDDLILLDDRFSWIVDDYVALEQSFQGIAESFGYEFRLLRVSEGSNDLFGYVKYVVPGGPADIAGLTRGTLFNAVNGIQITVDNYISALYESDSYELMIAIFDDDQVFSTQRTLSLVAVELVENPIHVSKVLDLDGVKVGYLAYNQFVNNNQFHRELNNVFADFKSEGISEFVLDLRYNPGGSLTTALLLSSMIYGNATASSNFGSIIYNSKLNSHFKSSMNFFESLPIVSNGQIVGEEPLNRLENLTRVFVLTSGNTASASELLIVGLAPYVDVITLGTKTVGKNVGSITLYDSKKSLFRKTETSEISTKHTYAIQPIISKLANSAGFSDYADGLEPDIVIDEKNFLVDLKPLGDLQEPLLEKVVEIISGNARTAKNNMERFYPFFYNDPKQNRLQKTLIELDMPMYK